MIVVVVGYRPLQMRYHLSQFGYWKKVYDKENASYRRRTGSGISISPSFSPANQKYHHHKNRLAELGAIVVKRHPLRHIKPMSPEALHFGRRMRELPSLEANLAFSRNGDALIVDAWIAPEWEGRWDAFISDNDISDYRRRRMGGSSTVNQSRSDASM